MPRQADPQLLDPWATTAASLEACDELQANPSEDADRPQALLSAFAVHMAAQGQPVRIDLMRRDREYALWQLARAHGLDDPELKQLAARLFESMTRLEKVLVR